MTVLSDIDILNEVSKGSLLIDPFKKDNVQPASYDITLSNEFMRLRPTPNEIDIEDGVDKDDVTTVEREEYTLHPNEFVLATTEERFRIPDYIIGDIRGRSSIGRMGLIPHTAGWVDSGFNGQITLELYNMSSNEITIKSGMRIGQIVFKYTRSRCQEPYGDKEGSKYQGQMGTTASKIEEDEELEN